MAEQIQPKVPIPRLLVTAAPRKKQRKRKPEEEKAANKKALDEARGHTRVNIGVAFQRWRQLRDLKGLKNDAEVALFLLDRPSDAPETNGHSRVLGHQGGGAMVWKTEADPDIVPHPPKFSPKRAPGVQPPFSRGLPTPGELFSYFFDAEVLNILCENTNKNVTRSLQTGRKSTWREIDPEEMKKYLGLLLYMAVLDLPRVSDFWRTESIFRVNFPSTVMSRDRFMAISSNLHLSDPAEDALNEEKQGTEEYDCLHLVKPLLDIMRNRCMAVYHPKQHISMHERVVVTKARNAFKEFLKFFVLTDVNGYTVDFSLYAGKATTASGNGLSYDVGVSLVNKAFLGSGYIIYCDNFYTSPLLFRHLGQQGFGACGTYRKGRVGVPTTTENALNERSPRGSIRWIRDDDLLFVKWMDNREVSICTNVHPVYNGETVLRWQKAEDGQLQRVPVPRPTAVGEYNKYMGEADTSDMFIRSNLSNKTTKRWHISVFQHFLDIAVANSCILQKELCASQQKRPKTRQQFQEELSAFLLGVPLHGSPQRTPTENHFAVPTSQGHEKAQRASMGRRTCTVCKRSTPWMCEVCNVGLCLQLDRNCFMAYHTS